MSPYLLFAAGFVAFPVLAYAWFEVPNLVRPLLDPWRAKRLEQRAAEYQFLAGSLFAVLDGTADEKAVAFVRSNADDVAGHAAKLRRRAALARRVRL